MANEYVAQAVREIDGATYATTESTILTGTTNTAITMTAFRKVFSVVIDNDNTTSGHDITVKFNATTNDARTVKAGESLTVDDFEITAIYLTNASGSTVSYRIMMIGDAA